METLVTKLKSLVNNNLPVLGELLLRRVPNTSTLNKASIYIEGSGCSIITPDGPIYSSQPLPDGDYLIRITNKYNLSKFFLTQSGSAVSIEVNLSDFVLPRILEFQVQTPYLKGSFTEFIERNKQYFTNLTSFNGYGCNITENIEMIKDITSLTSSSWQQNPNLYGDIGNALGKLINLNTSYIMNTSVEGTLESVVERQIQNGRTSGTLNIRSKDNNVKLNSEDTNGTYKINFSNGTANISINDNIVASFNGNTWTYPE